MSVINGLGYVAGVRTPSKARASSAFRLPDQEDSARIDEPVAATAVFMPSLLAMQEAESGMAQDRDAKQHGESLLDALAALQRALLGAGSSNELATLAGLARSLPPAADPRLATVQRALLVRVSVELARRQVSAST